LLGMRFLLLAVFLSTALLLKRVKQPATYDWIVLLYASYSLFHLFFINMTRQQIHLQHVPLDIIALFTLYMLAPNRLLFRIFPGIVFTVASLIQQFIARLPGDNSSLRFVFMAFVLVNILGIWTSIRLYFYRRQQYEAQTRSAELRKDLMHNAMVDELTGVANRRHFFHSAEIEFERFQRYKRSFSVLMLDLDHFKRINDQLGHPAGDKVLRDFARIIGQNKRDIDIFGRLGGEEFALILPETELSGAVDIAVRLRRSCWTIAVSSAADLRITVSLGVTQSRTGDMNFDEVLARADEALYRAKKNGRDRLEVA
jgi:diguanylate cyclase (GGDEF)-like protein